MATKKDKNKGNDIVITDDIKKLIEQSKSPFESTNDYITKLVNLNKTYQSQKGNEFITKIFQDQFLSCSNEYLEQYDAHGKKEKLKNSLKEQIKQNMVNLLKENDEHVLTLLLMIDECFTLLFQTDFNQLLSGYEGVDHTISSENLPKLESELVKEE